MNNKFHSSCASPIHGQKQSRLETGREVHRIRGKEEMHLVVKIPFSGDISYNVSRKHSQRLTCSTFFSCNSFIPKWNQLIFPKNSTHNTP